jgi:hypothetical protein
MRKNADPWGNEPYKRKRITEYATAINVPFSDASVGMPLLPRYPNRETAKSAGSLRQRSNCRFPGNEKNFLEKIEQIRAVRLSRAALHLPTKIKPYPVCTPAVTAWPLSVRTVVLQPLNTARKMIALSVERRMVRIII